MSLRHHARTPRRIALVGAAALAATLAMTGTAFAHAEVEADKPQALAENVTLSFVSEAESNSAGFSQLRIVLPEGIVPGDVRLGEAPKGWKLKATDDGYTVGGPALKAGVDAEHKIKIRQLPEAKEIAFKTVETYSDGKISRWIEMPTGGEEPEQPAPVLKLEAAAPGAKTVSPSPTESTTPSTAASTSSAAVTETDASQAASDTAADNEDGMSSGAVAGVVVVVLLVLGGGAWWLVKRRAASSES
ncbi:DUF1775 domain-containing protein [Streptomyces sp. NPDC058086]|uniref:DUF1775 domain-containing protein n=1 Tax=Streptomyces sp. NPDC058086 TaxID=3346334 RepID=UPI0036E3D62D